MGKWLLIVIGVTAISAFVAVVIGQAHESARADELVDTLIRSAPRPVIDNVDLNALSELPPPVARYFKQVLTQGQKPIKMATIRQSGVLRTSTTTKSWSSFTAHQFVAPPATGFVWNARVEMPFATHVRVLDSYVTGVGSGRVSLMSAFAIASESGAAALNSGALHRYLAEAVWFPTALLPQSGVVWSPIHDRAALASLTDNGITVSLEFRFNEAGEVTSIYSPGRFGRFDGEYKQVPWEGHFRNYQDRAGIRVPLYGEVGWYVDGTLQIVWKGDLIDLYLDHEP